LASGKNFNQLAGALLASRKQLRLEIEIGNYSQNLNVPAGLEKPEIGVGDLDKIYKKFGSTIKPYMVRMRMKLARREKVVPITQARKESPCYYFSVAKAIKPLLNQAQHSCPKTA